MIGTLQGWFDAFTTGFPTIWFALKILLFTLMPLIIGVAFYTLAERKVIGWMQVRRGPQHIGGIFGMGILQPFADVLKLLIKEIVVPTNANQFLFRVAPLLTRDPLVRRLGRRAGCAGARLVQYQRRRALPAGDELDGDLRHHPRGLGLEFEVRVPGRDALGRADGELRAGDGHLHRRRAAAGGLAEPERHRRGAGRRRLLEVVLAAAAADVHGVPDLRRGRNQPRAVRRRGRGERDRRGVPRRVRRLCVRDLLPRRVREHDPGVVHHGAAVLGRLAVAAPGPGLRVLSQPSPIWFALKVGFFMFVFLWFRATFPRYRYDQIMRLGWKVFIPITLVWVLVAGWFAYSGIVGKGMA
jgi:hypothetical protein